MKNKLYLFDFDGTITKRDTLFDFLKFSFPEEYKGNYGKFIPKFIAAKIKLKDAGKVKEKFIASFLKGKSEEEIQKLANNYFENNKSSLFREKVEEFINNINDADKYLVTASLDIWVKPFAEYLKLKLISTQAEFKNGIFTGKFSTPNCNYQEKVNRIIKIIPLKEYQEVYAFGDSEGDKYMLDLANHPYMKFFE